MIDRELQRRVIVTQLLAPVRQLPFLLTGFEPVVLPCGVVGVLDRQLRQHGFRSLHSGTVTCSEFVDDDAIGPGIRDNMMHHDHQMVFL